MSTSPNKRAVTVGIFVVLGLVFLVAGILVIGNIHQTFSKKLRVTTLFDDVNGLQKGSNIWFSGVKIGTVKQVDFYGASQVKVVMNIDREAQQYIRRDAKVKISTDGLIGNKILVIYGGTERVSFVTEDDTLSVEKTLSTEDMISTLQENNLNLVSITSDFKIISKKLAAGEIVKAVKTADRNLIDTVNVFDVYEGKGVPEGKKSVAVAVRIQPKDATLTDAEIEALAQKIVAGALEKTRPDLVGREVD